MQKDSDLSIIGVYKVSPNGSDGRLYTPITCIGRKYLLRMSKDGRTLLYEATDPEKV
jgi:hypothetical protein